MNNAINYYYQLYPLNIHQTNKILSFKINDEQYILTPLSTDPKKLNDLYSISNHLIQYQILVHQLMPNINNQLITTVNNIPYILQKKYQTSTDKISLIDILRFHEQTSFVIDQTKKIQWKELWESKVDYFEYQVNQFGKKFPIIRKSCSYYIGLSEMAISLLNFIKTPTANTTGTTPLVLSHYRITKNTTYTDLFDTLNFVIDSRTRDVAEYFKNKFMGNYYIMDEIEDFLQQNLSSDEYLLFFSRMLFPSYYFDCFEDIVNQQKDEKELLSIIEKSKDFEELIVELYYIIQQYTRIPEIDWFKFYNKY